MGISAGPMALCVLLAVAAAQSDLVTAPSPSSAVAPVKLDTGAEAASTVELPASPAPASSSPQPDAGLNSSPKLEQQIRKHRESLEMDLQKLDAQKGQKKAQKPEQKRPSKHKKQRRIQKAKASKPKRQKKLHKKGKKVKESNISRDGYTTLRDDVVDLLHNYQRKYPQCIYIPPQMIPEQPATLASKSAACKANFIRGWTMGTDWARFIFGNKRQKLHGWSLLTLTLGHFKANFRPAKNGISCAYRGLKKGYFLNFERLEEKKKAKLLKRYAQLEKYKYASLKQLYKRLKEKV